MNVSCLECNYELTLQHGNIFLLFFDHYLVVQNCLLREYHKCDEEYQFQQTCQPLLHTLKKSCKLKRKVKNLIISSLSFVLQLFKNSVEKIVNQRSTAMNTTALCF